jgi:hypothetical protein
MFCAYISASVFVTLVFRGPPVTAMSGTSTAASPLVTSEKLENYRRNIFPLTPLTTPDQGSEDLKGKIVSAPDHSKPNNFGVKCLWPPTPETTPEKPKNFRGHKSPEPDSLSADGSKRLDDRKLTGENLLKNNIKIFDELRPSSSHWPKHVLELKSYLHTNLNPNEVSYTLESFVIIVNCVGLMISSQKKKSCGPGLHRQM